AAQHRGFRELAPLSEAGPPPLLPLGRGRIVAVVFCVILLLLSAGIPLGVLIAEAGSLPTYLKVMRETGSAAGVSLATGVAAAGLAVAVALPLALLTERRFGQLSTPVTGGLAVLATVPYALPGA